MFSLFELFICIYVITWLLVVIIFNCKILNDNYIAILGNIFLLPNWSFFSPNPLITDYNLYYKIYDKYGQSEFILVEYANPNKTYHTIINIGKRKTKFILDIILSFVEELKKVNKSDYSNIPFSLQYIILLNLVISKNTREKVDFIQFKITEISYKNSCENLIFQSNKHIVK